MQVYLNKAKRNALLMMIQDAEAMMSGNADGWYGLDKIDPEFYGEIAEAVGELRELLNSKGYDFDTDIKPIVGD